VTRFVARQTFKLGPFRIERTDYLKSRVYELMLGEWLSIEVGRWFFIFKVVI